MAQVEAETPAQLEQEQSGGQSVNSRDVAQAVAEALEATEEEKATETEAQTLQQDTYWVVREYLPKIYGCLLFIIGFMVFAFIYITIKNNIARHFV